MKYDLSVIGHLSIDTNQSDFGTKKVPGGSAYLVALPATLYSDKVGLVSRVGGDYPIDKLKRFKGLDSSGVKVMKNERSSRFYHVYLTKDHSKRTWKPEFNAGEFLCYKDIAENFLNSKYFHVATMPPEQQLPIIKG